MVGGQDAQEERTAEGRYASGQYWETRADLMYYRYIEVILRTVARDADSLIDVGTGNSGYMEWFDWIDERLSVDIGTPYSSENVEGRVCDILKTDFGRRFDVCTCFQVLEHVPEADRFARRLLELGETVVVSVPFKWPEGKTRGHRHDPVDREKLRRWMGRAANYDIVVREPFTGAKGRRLIAVYAADPDRRYTARDFRARPRREMASKV